jgi:methionine-rich copper-binding protein CopC
MRGCVIRSAAVRRRLLVAGAFAAGVLAVRSVFAHAEPAKVTPGDGAVLTTPPATIEITMSQEMARRDGANEIDVLDATGTEVTSVGAIIDNGNRRKLSVALPANLAPGRYTVKWKTLSAEDGDTGGGTLSFTYDPVGTPSPGREVLRADLLGGETPTAGLAPPGVTVPSGGGDGTSWVLVVAVAAGMFVLGAGSAYVLVQRKP